jgi:protoporphyrinogen oxidase
MKKEKAIIIGAGPAGLTAAWQLLKETDVEPIILEESGEIGGIARTVKHNGNRMDIGGHRFFSKNEQIMKMWNDIMPLQGGPASDDRMLEREKEFAVEGPDPELEERVMLMRDRVSRIFYLRKFFDYPISGSPETFINMGFKNTVRAGLGYLKSMVVKREENSLEDFMINRFGQPLYEMFFEDYTEKVWGKSPKELSADWGAQRIKGLSLSEVWKDMWRRVFKKEQSNQEVETSLINRFYYPKKGPGQLWESLADDVQDLGATLKLHTKVKRIQTNAGIVTSVVVEDDAGEYTIDAEHFFSTMPVKDLVDGMNDVPSDVKTIAHELPYRDFITVGLLVDKLEIENKTTIKTVNNIVPDCWIYIQERDVKIGRLQIFNNWSPYMVNDPENSVWIGLEYFCNEGDELWNRSSEDFIAFATEELVKIGIIKKEVIQDATHVRVKKAYPSYHGSYESFDQVREYLDTFTNLYCIGRNGQHRYNNMDHSMLTAIKAVDCLKTGKVDKSSIWEVNTEENYHEKKG